MSIVVNLNQKQGKIKKVDLPFLENWLQQEKASFGLPNEALVLCPYEGEADIRGQLLVLYQPKKIGRGIGFFVDQDYRVEMNLNYPNTEEDICLFYQLIESFCNLSDTPEFDQEGEVHFLSQIDALKEEAILFNRDLVKNNLKPDLQIFGAVYPITLEKELIKKLRKLQQEEAVSLFSTYLHEKQSLDCYYAKPKLYKHNQTGEISACYALTENVRTIFPVRPILPYPYHLPDGEKVANWEVHFVVESQEENYQMLGVLSFEEAFKILSFKKKPHFDADHIVITFDAEAKEKVKKALSKKKDK